MDNKTRLSLFNGIADYIQDIETDLNNKIDDLEAKNGLLRKELDGIYKVLNMDACDIKDLQDKVFNGYTREQKGDK